MASISNRKCYSCIFSEMFYCCSRSLGLWEENLNKNETVGRVIAGLELIVGAMAVGALIAEAIMGTQKSKSGKQSKAAVPGKEPRSIHSQMVESGILLIHRKQDVGESLHDFLKSRYNGLYLLGRAGHQLDGDELDTLSADLAHWHKLCHQVNGHDADRALSEWYSTVGQSRTIPLLRLLDRCVAVENTLGMPAYIAFCLTGILPAGYQQDIPDDEMHAIRRHFKL